MDDIDRIMSIVQVGKDKIDGKIITKIENDYIYTQNDCIHKSWLATYKIKLTD